MQALLEENLKQKELREKRTREKEQKEIARREALSVKKEQLMKTKGFDSHLLTWLPICFWSYHIPESYVVACDMNPPRIGVHGNICNA